MQRCVGLEVSAKRGGGHGGGGVCVNVISMRMEEWEVMVLTLRIRRSSAAPGRAFRSPGVEPQALRGSVESSTWSG